MARNEGILVNDFRKMMLDGHTDKIIKMLTFDDKTLVDIIQNTMDNKHCERTVGRESKFVNTYTTNVLTCPIDFIQIDVTTRTYPVNTVIYTFDIMYYNDAIEHMGVSMDGYCHHKITVSDSGLYTKRFTKWIKDTAADIYNSLVSAWKFADKYAPEFIAAFDEILDERKSMGIDIDGLYGAYVPAEDTDDNTTTVSAKDDDGVKIITVKNPKNVDKIIKQVTECVKNFRKDAASTTDDLMDKINSFLNAEDIEHTIRNLEQEDTNNDIQDEQSDPDREPEPEDDIHEPVEDETNEDEDETESEERCDCDNCECMCDDTGSEYAQLYKDLISMAITSQLMNNMNNHMLRNKLNYLDVNLVPGLVAPLQTTCNIMLSMSPFKVNAKKPNTPLDGRVTIGIYNRETSKCYFNQVFDFSELTIEEVESVKGIDLRNASRAVREEQLFDAVEDRIQSEIDLNTMFMAIGFAEGWCLNSPDAFNPNEAIMNDLYSLYSSYAYGAVLTDLGDDMCDTDAYLDPHFAEWYNNLPVESFEKFDTEEDLLFGFDEDDDDDEDGDDDSVNLEDIVNEKNGYFMTDVDTKEE